MPRPPAFSTSAGASAVAFASRARDRTAGTRSSETPAVNPKTFMFQVQIDEHAIPCRRPAVRPAPGLSPRATSKPSAVPIAASKTLSTSSWRTMRRARRADRQAGRRSHARARSPAPAADWPGWRTRSAAPAPVAASSTTSGSPNSSRTSDTPVLDRQRVQLESEVVLLVVRRIAAAAASPP